jgi:hypothetical protein
MSELFVRRVSNDLKYLKRDLGIYFLYEYLHDSWNGDYIPIKKFDWYSCCLKITFPEIDRKVFIKFPERYPFC